MPLCDRRPVAPRGDRDAHASRRVRFGRPAWAATAVVACSLAPLSTLTAQTGATMDLGVMDVRYDGFLPSAGASVSPEFRLERPHLLAWARGTYLHFESGRHSIQANTAGSLLSGPWRGLRAEIAGHAGISQYADFASFSHLLATPRVHLLGDADRRLDGRHLGNDAGSVGRAARSPAWRWGRGRAASGSPGSSARPTRTWATRPTPTSRAPHTRGADDSRSMGRLACAPGAAAAGTASTVRSVVASPSTRGYPSSCREGGIRPIPPAAASRAAISDSRCG